ncbi:unnamed protein product [Tuber aestivum]|uniref:Uncharacterized protein n=1 Tax=Tuber aestivum TaxID=59557 RepID=A0A292PVV7_9PEZI|nr:unnamed protein product [Tuber aestivum]
MGAFQNRFGVIFGRLSVVSGAIFRSGGPSGREGRTDSSRTLRRRALRRIPKGPQHRSMRIAALARGKLYLRGMFARKAKAKAKSEMEEAEEIKEEDQDFTTIGAIATMTETQIPNPSTAYPPSLKLPNIAIHAMTSPTMPMEVTTPTNAGKARRTRTPRKIQQGPRRRSVRILESAQRSKQGKLAAGATAQASGLPVTAAPTTKKTNTRDQIPAKVVSKTRFPVLKPRAGAGVTKRTVTGTPGGQIVSEAETQAMAVEENITATTTIAATPTGTQALASPSQTVGSGGEEVGGHISAASVADKTGAQGTSGYIAVEEASTKVKVENEREESTRRSAN